MKDPATSDETPGSETPDPFIKFLLVDDNLINLKVLAAYMKKLGIEYDTAMDGQEAVDLFCRAEHAYSCVLMDISMPVMDGFEASRCIRAHELQQTGKRVPIIALSGLASEDAHKEAIGSGIDVLLTKPVKLKALGNLLESRKIIPFNARERAS
jgi:CheY-like chemotaxis protein